jgi:drug/metabolite transporter (DMT)-like permease
LVLVSCLLHAGWNLACKAKTPSAAFFTYATLASVMIMTPLYCYFIPRLHELPASIWGILAATGFSQAFYYICLANAYRLADMSLTYPIVRALPVLMVPMVCHLLGIGAPVSSLSIAGMIVVVVGCMILPLKAVSLTFLSSYLQLAYLFVVLTAMGITGYSVIDSVGLKMIADGGTSFSQMEIALFYIAFENLAILPFLALYVFLSPQERGHFHHIRKESLRYTVMTGFASTVGYTLILVAMQFASNVSYVVAFRQVSILIGVIFGAVILKEKVTRLRAFSTGLVFLGLVIVALGS